MNLLEELRKGPPKRPEIIIDRSELELYLRCPQWCKLAKEFPLDDFDGEKMKYSGIAFHGVMAEAITDTLAGGSFAEAVQAHAANSPPQYQPHLNDCAYLVARKWKPWTPSYISHEKQYAYRIPNLGPKGEDVLLTCRPDYVEWDSGADGLHLPDWKSGWGMAGFDFQAMFYSVVLFRAAENVKSICWQPLFCRRGTWGKRYDFDAEQIDQAEAGLRRAAMDYLTEEDWLPTPGGERCRICPYTERCEAPKRWADIDADPEAFLLGYIKAAAELKDMAKALTAKVEKTGPICANGHNWSLNVISSRPRFGLRKGEPELIGADADADAEQ